jgi:hypothetical protein
MYWRQRKTKYFPSLYKRGTHAEIALGRGFEVL